VRLLLDEMYPATIAEQLRSRGHDVATLHDSDFRQLEGAADADVFAAAVDERRVLVTENVSDFRRLEGEALARGDSTPGFVFTTNRQFPRGHPATVGRIVAALDELLAGQDTILRAVFLKG
jgi:hypothetical protein